MYHRLVKILVFGVLATVGAQAQSVSTLMSPRVLGLGNTSVAMHHEWALWSNPAGAAELKKLTTGFALHKSPALVGANRMAAVGNFLLKAGVVSAGVFRFGDAVYNEQLAAASFSHQLGLTSLGLRLDLIQIRAEGFQTHLAWGVTLGGITQLTQQIFMGALVSNLNQPRFPNGEYLPVVLRMGPLFKPNEKVVIALEIEKDIDYPPTWKGGFEYVIHKKVAARTGFNMKPQAAYFGIGYRAWKLSIDYAIQYSSWLSASHQVGVLVTPERKKK
jgi:hypothetical protein